MQGMRGMPGLQGLTKRYKFVTLFYMRKKRKTPVTRVNLSLPQNMVYLVQMLAERDDVPLTTKATELLEQGLDAEEDTILVEMAEKRLADLESGKEKALSSEEFWKLIENDQKKK